MHFLSLFFTFAATLASIVNAGCFKKGQTGTLSDEVKRNAQSLCMRTLSGFYVDGQQRGNCVPDADPKKHWFFRIKKTGGKDGSLRVADCDGGLLYWMLACPTRGGKGTAYRLDRSEIGGFEFSADVNGGSCQDPAYSMLPFVPQPTHGLVANPARARSLPASVASSFTA
ncbi:hypothetical protein K469DRAFT_761484 [Zopfia rhizophila CBS 207.26]|uniref:Secreted protein n=1 Tax=Zopfia rhizophila CBS 207.26 TaxID=1314779 RepID=A0A6A6DCA8_9PEZI|nr:hypothetical protein K469DRAFT_761484 [Zopfia rhizophila CBS 207.26]